MKELRSDCCPPIDKEDRSCDGRRGEQELVPQSFSPDEMNKTQAIGSKMRSGELLG